MKFIHLTDPHFGYEGQEIYQRDPTHALERAIDSINKEHSDAQMVVITGDLAHSGHPDAYTRLFTRLEKLQIPYYLIIGNHDHRPTLAKLFNDFVLDEYGFAQQVIKTQQGRFLLLDTVQEGTHAGVYCAQRFAWLKQQLEEAKDENIYIFMHHAPFATRLAAMDTIGLEPTHSQQFAELLSNYPNVKHIFFGHYHRPIAGQWQGIAFSTLRSMNHQVRLDFNNQQMILGCFEEPQYCVVFLQKEQTLVHYHDYMHQNAKFDIGSPTET